MDVGSALGRVLDRLSQNEEATRMRAAALVDLDRDYRSELERIDGEEAAARSDVVARQAESRAEVKARLNRLERSYQGRIREAERAVREESRQLEALRNLLDGFEARIPADLEAVPACAPESLEGGSGFSEDEAESLLAIMADKSLFAGARRLLGGTSSPSRKDACARLKGMIALERGLLAEKLSLLREEDLVSELRRELAEERRKIEDSPCGPEPTFDALPFEMRRRHLDETYAFSRSRIMSGASGEESADAAFEACVEDAEEAAHGLGCLKESWRGDGMPPDAFPEEIALCWVEVADGSRSLFVPYSFPLENPLHCWIEAKERRAEVLGGIRAYLATLVRRMPPNGVRVFWFDPVSKGRSLGNLAPWTRPDADDEVLVNVATSGDDARRLFHKLDELMGTVGMAVAGEGSVSRHNALLESDHVPYTVVVAQDLDSRYYGRSELDILDAIIGNADALGMQVIALVDDIPCDDEGKASSLRAVKEHCAVLSDAAGALSIDVAEGRFPVRLLDETAIPRRFIDEAPALWRGRAFEEDAVQEKGTDGSQGIVIPFGTTDAGREACLEFGVDYAHAIVTGAPGAGKSVFLHNVVESACSRYSPEELTVWLVDYKKTEFGLYRDPQYRFPHISFIGLDGSADFVEGFVGLLMTEFMRRQELILAEGTRGIGSYNSKVVPEARLPRLLVVIDEFHRQADLMLNDEGDTRTSFEQILRESRAYGMHILIADQTLSGMSGLTDAARKQMAGRVLFKWSEPSEVADMLGAYSDVAQETLAVGEAYAKVRGVNVRCSCRFVGEDEIAASAARQQALFGDHGSRSCRCFDANERAMLPHEADSRGRVALPVGEVPNFSDPEFGIELRSRKKENAFILDAGDGLAFDVASLLLVGMFRRHGTAGAVICDPALAEAEGWDARWNEMARLMPLRILPSPSEVCEYFAQGDLENVMIVLQGFDEMSEAFEQLPSRSEATAPRSGGRAELDALLASTASLIGDEGAHREAMDAEGAAHLYDAREPMLRVLQQGGARRVHVCWIADSIPSIRSVFSGIDVKGDDFDTLFAHRFAGKCSRRDSYDLGMGSKAHSIPADEREFKMVYADRAENAVLFKPYATDW
ncbi:FtsK/SpoIIIE domain-containing protein [Arabiibacter massiliensis]|uniref:FtsK/SpoIIIE domain-containing protein n=1 Tax=Arabiibacter massiliensis TaxID=1870985 RepID=UPI0009B97A8B|nr:FtsK/SpoIIIE domain-containing protein [Arabiibacter massiliensis]